MQVLSYNAEEQFFFIGLSFTEFEEIIKNFTVNFVDNSNYELEKQKSRRNSFSPKYVKMIRELYRIDKYPFICVVVDEKLKITVVPSHYPFSPLWNGYSPWKNLKPFEIKEFSELKFNSI